MINVHKYTYIYVYIYMVFTTEGLFEVAIESWCIEVCVCIYI